MSLDPHNQKLNWLSEMFEVTSKPVVYDADNGGNVEILKIFNKKIREVGCLCNCNRRQKLE